MKLGFSMPHMIRLNGFSKPWEANVAGPDQLRLARWADKLGFAEIAVPEHYIIPQAYVPQAGPHHLSAYAGMASYAGATENIRVNSCIALLPAINPIVTAKILATMDWISGGRVTITFAVGWCKEEYDMLGVPFHERGRSATSTSRRSSHCGPRRTPSSKASTFHSGMSPSIPSRCRSRTPRSGWAAMPIPC